MLKFFIKWLKALNVEKSALRVRLHLYSDMNIKKENAFWSKELGIPLQQFRKPYIKRSRRSDITWRKPAEHGTCNVIFYNKPLHDYVLMSMKRLREIAQKQ